VWCLTGFWGVVLVLFGGGWLRGCGGFRAWSFRGVPWSMRFISVEFRVYCAQYSVGLSRLWLGPGLDIVFLVWEVVFLVL